MPISASYAQNQSHVNQGIGQGPPGLDFSIFGGHSPFGGTPVGPPPGFNASVHTPTSSIPGMIGRYNSAYTDWLARRSASQGPNLMTQLAMAGFSDAQRMQNAANNQWGANNQQIEGMQGFVEGQVPQFQQYAGEEAGQLHDIASQLQTQAGGSFDEFDKFRDQSLDEMRSGIQSAIGTAQGAAKEFSSAIDAYKDTGYQDAQVVGAGIRESFQQQMQMVNAGLRPDGSRMTTGEQMQARMQVGESVNRSVASAAAPMISRVNENILQANSRLADLKNITSGLQMQGAALGASTETTFSGQRVQLEQQAQQMQEFAASLNASAAGLASAAHLNAVNFEMQGRMNIAGMVYNNPQTVVGLMPIFAQLMALGSAPGAGNIHGINPSVMQPFGSH